MDNEYRVALDIWTYLYRLYYGTSKKKTNYIIKFNGNDSNIIIFAMQ